MSNHVSYKYDVPSTFNPMRLSEIPIDHLPLINSKSSLKKHIKKRLVEVNDHAARTGTWIYPNDTITIYVDPAAEKKLYPLNLDVAFEDNYIAVVDQPSGLIVAGNRYRTLENALPFNHNPTDSIDRLSWIRPVHRLDAVTSGLVITAKTITSLTKLHDQFKNHSIQKYYLALVDGEINDHGVIDIPINGKISETSFRLLNVVKSEKYGSLSFVEITIHTGRTHQIRIHFAEIGHPIVGDNMYNHLSTSNVKGLFLHAHKLEFLHPITQEIIEISSPLPKRFKSFGLEICVQ